MFRPLYRAVLALCVLGLLPSESQGQVLFVNIDEVSGAQTTTSVGLDSCSDQSADTPEDTPSSSGASTCISGVDDFRSTATSSYSGVFMGDPDDVTGASLSAELNASSDPNPLGNMGSKFSGGSSFVRLNFNAISPVRYQVTLTTSVNSTGFSQLGEDEASAMLASTSFATVETISVEENFGEDTQTITSEGILAPGNFSLRVSTRGTAAAPFTADGVTAMATLEVTFEPVLSGGCCIDDSCSQLTQEECAAQSGVYAGDNEDCVDCAPEVVSCDLAWDEASAGNFSSASNWLPEAVPTDNGAGCNNLFPARTT